MEIIKSVFLGVVAIVAAVFIWKFIVGILKFLLIGGLAVGMYLVIRDMLG